MEVNCHLPLEIQILISDIPFIHIVQSCFIFTCWNFKVCPSLKKKTFWDYKILITWCAILLNWCTFWIALFKLFLTTLCLNVNYFDSRIFKKFLKIESEFSLKLPSCACVFTFCVWFFTNEDMLILPSASGSSIIIRRKISSAKSILCNHEMRCSGWYSIGPLIRMIIYLTQLRRKNSKFARELWEVTELRLKGLSVTIQRTKNMRSYNGKCRTLESWVNYYRR